MIYDCCVRQKKCPSILKHILKRYNNRKSCLRPVASLSHATKIAPCKSTLKPLLKTGLISGPPNLFIFISGIF